jgi:hypothetical protein
MGKSDSDAGTERTKSIISKLHKLTDEQLYLLDQTLTIFLELKKQDPDSDGTEAA